MFLDLYYSFPLCFFLAPVRRDRGQSILHMDEVGDVVNWRNVAPIDGERPPGVDCSVESTGNAAEDS